MKRLAVAALLAAMSALAGFCVQDAAAASPVGKVLVCKYVGTPGVGERLQTGQNPISVSIAAINGYQGVGSYFNDAQGRSLVLAEDVGQDEPSASQCPSGGPAPTPTETPTPTPTETVTPSPTPTATASPSSGCHVLLNGHLVTTNICSRPSFPRTHPPVTHPPVTHPPVTRTPVTRTRVVVAAPPVKTVGIVRKPTPRIAMSTPPHAAAPSQRLANTGARPWTPLLLAVPCLVLGLGLVVRSRTDQPESRRR